MAARFTQGTNLQSTRKNVQEGKVGETARGHGTAGGVRRGNTMQGIPGYIKTAQDASSSGLASATNRRGRSQSGPRREGAIPAQKGESRRNWQAASSTGGSQDKSYYKTSTDKAGTVRVLGQPKAPASRSKSEMETTPGGTAGRRNAVSGGGVDGANRLPAGGATPRSAIHIPDTGKGKPKGGQGSAPASGQSARARGGFSVTARESSIGNKAPPTAKGFIGGGRGTMESLRGRPRGKSTMY